MTLIHRSPLFAAASALVLSLAMAPTAGAAQDPAERSAALQKALQAVDTALAKLETIPDYTYHLRKQERVDNVLLEPQFLVTKIRHKPFSVYLRFTAPSKTKGKEAIYIDGQNDGKLIGHDVGLKGLFGTQRLDPKSALAMSGNRNPITDSGMKNLLLKLKNTLEQSEKIANVEFVWLDSEEEVDKRPCQCLEIRNPMPLKEQVFARSKISFDREWQLPVRFQRWYWSQPGGGKEQLVEDYTYEDVEFNVGLKDIDFDPSNPEYKFN